MELPQEFCRRMEARLGAEYPAFEAALCAPLTVRGLRVNTQKLSLEAFAARFPVPAQYAHPIVLTRMIRILREGRAQTAKEALEVLKSDLRALNSSVQVTQEEYDEVVVIKPLFLVCDYQ